MIWLRVAQGVLCAVEICGLYYLLQVFFDKRNDKAWSNILWFLSGVFIWGLTVYHRETVAMYSRYYMIFCIVISGCMQKIYLHIKTIQTVLINVLYYESIYFFDVFLGYIGQVLINDIGFIDVIQFEINIHRIIIMLLSRLIIWIVLVFIFRHKVLISRLFNKYQLIFAGFAILEYTGLFFCEQVFIPDFRIEGKIYAYFSLFPIIIVLTLILVMFYIMYIEKKNEIQLTNYKNEMLEKNYHEMLILYQKRDRIFHDMKNHLSVLSLLISDKNLTRAEEYISKINEPILALEHKKYTENRIVNIILNDKYEKAENCGIHFNITAKDLKEGVIQDIDWCAILANLLDNAIEACLKVNKQNRKIDLFLGQNDCATMITISNTYDGELETKNNKLLTSKTGVGFHGIGIESIRSAVDKYNGVFEYSFKKDIFIINISLFSLMEE